MSTTVSEGGRGKFQEASEGAHPARAFRVLDLGTQPGSDLYPNPKKKIVIFWELSDETVEVDGEPKPQIVSEWFTASLHEKSKLRPFLESWRGKPFTAEEAKGFDVAKLLGAPCLLNIIHNDDGRARIAGVMRLPKGMTAAEPFNPPVQYSIEDGESEVFKSLSERMQDIIRQAEEWRGSAAPESAQGDPVSSDDIPF